MNRETRRLQQREERRQKKADQDRQDRSSAKTPVQRAAAKRAVTPVEKKPLFRRLIHFFREVRAELKRVSWPTREQMVAFTTVTVITTIALTLFTFALDFGFKNGILTLLELGS